ncbi:PREDICTED: sushi, von Willebrand factor type A, EGF and pentraxin domain-containing protein 1-like [Priapulus caudatus]|uniref:Sushi, von Willebrand factor type A, EGF and pentraxin domain-containing protein 1-like n=1 Tax=Priapulus caudatus TaxID=37621 RepID=A0ABM1F0V6_PRICU|nr:PREDICTED: sushi, von Willebrand factor type A, EGF and pentraxin domain-containing protein 1-like [Priapulus caudatus]XP_014678078.1 PREDICTED: sushi, von Willebrand factor type A, EGF and pentraxin domain-containing protein 1-like [Priapulus caudatus]
MADVNKGASIRKDPTTAHAQPDSRGVTEHALASPAWVLRSAVFPAGVTEIEWSAYSTDRLKRDECTMKVHVLDKQLPSVSRCPASIEVVTSEEVQESQNYPPAVSWQEPEFTDNVHVQSVSKTHEPGERFERGDFVVKYVATDSSGNEATCEFGVSIKWRECDPPTGPENGNPNCVKWMYGMFCKPTCNESYTGYQLAGHKVYMCGGDATWYPSRHMPDCTPYTRYIRNVSCTPGYEPRLSDYKCVACPRGKYLPENATTCVPCEIGTYQDEFGQTSCKRCPAGRGSKADARNAEECGEARMRRNSNKNRRRRRKKRRHSSARS